MNRDIFAAVELSKDAQNVNEALAHIASACQTIQAAAGRLNQIAVSWNAKRTDGQITPEDITALTGKVRGLDALQAAVDAYLQGR